jgi:hypothetical protein
MHVWGKTKGEHIGWRNYEEWQTKCKNADIPDAPETIFRRWKKKEMASFDCEPTKDTTESAPIRHRDQGVCRTNESRMRTWMTVYHPTRRRVKQVGGGVTVLNSVMVMVKVCVCGGGDGDDDSMDDDEHDNEVLEETPPLPPDSD